MRRTLAGWVLGVVVIALGAACRSEPIPGPPHALLAIDAIHTRCDNPVVASMPDGGGYRLNGTPVRGDSVAIVLKARFAGSIPACRVVFVDLNPHRRWTDVAWLEREAARVGVASYDARRSCAIGCVETRATPVTYIEHAHRPDEEPRGAVNRR